MEERLAVRGGTAEGDHPELPPALVPFTAPGPCHKGPTTHGADKETKTCTRSHHMQTAPRPGSASPEL